MARANEATASSGAPDRSARRPTSASVVATAGSPRGSTCSEVHRDRLRRRARLGQDARRTRVQPRALPRRQPVQDGVPHERVLELERPGIPQDPSAHQLLAER